MRYRAENQLELFEFHDSMFSLVSFDGENLIVSVKHLNIHKDTEQNPFDYDMEIDYAAITFRGFRAPSYEPGRAWEMGADGKSYPKGPQVIYHDEDATEKITEELQHQIMVYDFNRKDGSRYFIDGCGIEPFFTMEFCFDSVIVEWNDYRKKAWYELHRQYRYNMTLVTSDEEEQVEVIVGCHDEDVFHKSRLEKAPSVNVGLRYAGKEIWGHGKELFWLDAFADLQKQLPEGVTMKCCLTCRYGDPCPDGNKPGELFCKEDAVEPEMHTKQYCDVCEAYQPKW